MSKKPKKFVYLVLVTDWIGQLPDEVFVEKRDAYKYALDAAAEYNYLKYDVVKMRVKKYKPTKSPKKKFTERAKEWEDSRA